ncbi:MAG: alpha-galactosidase [Lachnospiraceae bacterium]|nr:alpha-galactosidase [Lachnospiraceae bacterium]
MITRIENTFVLSTNQTTYAFSALKTGHLEHLYYGRKIAAFLPENIRKVCWAESEKEKDNKGYQPTGAESLFEKHAFAPGCANRPTDEQVPFSLEDINLEMSSYGKGDFREPFVEMVHGDGSATCDFLFEKAEITDGKPEMESDLPGSVGTSFYKPERLSIRLFDKQYGIALIMDYYVYEWCDVICRTSKLINESGETVWVKRLLSGQLDFDRAGYVMSNFTGAWAREMNRSDIPLQVGRFVNSSYTGSSSNHANPFVMLSQFGTTEDRGNAWGLNLVYSGNHYTAGEVSSHGKTRVVWGMNPLGLSWELLPGASFEAPEAVMTFSHEGFNGMSRHMHDFVSEHIVRGMWKKKERPILLNSWEAAYFDINEHKLLKLAKAAKDVGIELFVMDDGWFLGRNDDTSSLGDWEADPKKLPDGLKGLSEKIKRLGIDFGLWVEPEMVNVKSKLYEAHPEWVLQIPGKPHAEGRNQRILDLTQTAVQDYIIDAMSKVFSEGDISYVKWDMNRTMTDVFSQALEAKNQGEVFHRYMLGLYRVAKTLTEKFPRILFEGCSSGGNRFDLGMLCYFPQIWGSDDTDAICRATIQTGYSYGYPPQCVSAHVSAVPNHQTLRTTPLSTRFAVAAFGSFGYECNLCDMKAEEVAAIKEQVALYKEWRSVFFSGHFYRGRSFLSCARAEADAGSGMRFGNANESGNITEWTMVSPDRTKAVGMIVQKLNAPNTRYQYFTPKGLDPEGVYHMTGQPLKHNIKAFGDLVNTVSPVHIKQDSMVHNVLARFIKMDGETEDYLAYGDSLMYAGVKLSQAFGGTGYDERVRFFPDFASRLYFFEKLEEKKSSEA